MYGYRMEKGDKRGRVRTKEEKREEKWTKLAVVGKRTKNESWSNYYIMVQIGDEWKSQALIGLVLLL